MKPLALRRLAANFKNSYFLVWLWFFLFAFLFSNYNYALAVGDAYFPQDTTVNLTVGGVSTNFTIVAASDADTVVVDTSTITVTISSGQSFQITSADKKKLINNSTIQYTCTSSEASLTLTVSTQTVIVITPESETCTAGGGSGTGGGGGTGSGTVSSTSVVTPTPTPTPTSTPTLTATPTPVPTSLPQATPTSTPVPVVTGSTPTARGFVSLAAVSLKEGDVVSAAGSSDPDVYIVNSWGYKRLFLNPVIFGFYGHLGGFSKVKNTASSVRDTLVTSGLFRNCETNDPKVYGAEVTGEDTGTLHWVNTTGAQAVADDSEFFKKVFCINTKEFSWYKKGSNYTSVNQIPAYNRKTSSSSPVSQAPISSVSSLGKIKVVSSLGWLNVRDSNSTAGNIVGKVLSGEEYSYIEFKGGWYKIQKDGKNFGWVSGDYVAKL